MKEDVLTWGLIFFALYLIFLSPIVMSSEECQRGDYRCDPNKPNILQTCKYNLWTQTSSWVTAEECEYICENNICIECQRGDYRCDPDNPRILQICKYDLINGISSWITAERCKYGCENGACIEGCQRGEYRCDPDNPNILQTCKHNLFTNEYSWITAERCKYGCENGLCIICSRGEYRCDPDNPNILQICKYDLINGISSWITAERCKYGCENGACIEGCQRGEYRCDPDNPNILQTCKYNFGTQTYSWVTAEECEYICENGACIEGCQRGDYRCDPDNPNILQTCKYNFYTNEYSWVTAEECRYGCENGVCLEEDKTELQISIATLKDSYNIGEQINLTDPPENEIKNFDNKKVTGFAVDNNFQYRDKVLFYETIDRETDMQPKTMTNVPIEKAFDFELMNFKGYIIEFEDDSMIIKKNQLEERATRNEDDFFLQALAVILPQTLEPVLPSNVQDKIENERAKIRSERENFKQNALQVLEKTQIVSQDTTRSEGINNLIILNEYENVFNGIALNITQEEAGRIKAIRGIKRVYPNYLVNITLSDSVPLINADDVWLLDEDGNNCIISGKDCLTGKGVAIAIIDTGVDYTHTDLGGCFGSGCKVIGGYDFVRNNNDPMDDHGHGTHVAAIAAGNGGLKGVAYDAQIYAYKVMNSQAHGYNDDIIAGIERAVDPNNDGDYSDHVDIISMSLGGPGNPDDPISQAVDNAVSGGVVVVVSAGNLGPWAGSIGSPGKAREAITVGASDKSDEIARFSSRGPVVWKDSQGNKKYLIKPDITAPGVDICAAQRDAWFDDKLCNNDQEHIAISGTSMAAPHVSGAAAILLQKNPDWTPEEIKMTLRNTAINIGEDINTQGYGRIDILNAIQLTNAPPIAKIITSGEVKGVFNIEGTASSNSFSDYSLFIKKESEMSWTEIITSSSQVNDGILLENFDSCSLQDGNYMVRLDVSDTNGQISKDHSLIQFNNIEVNSPLSYDIFRKGSTIEIKGSLSCSNFESYDIEYGIVEGANLSLEFVNTWSSNGITLTNENIPFEDKIIGYFDTSVIDKENPFYLFLRVNTYSAMGKTDEKQIILYIDPQLKEGWPKKIDAHFDSSTGIHVPPQDLKPLVSDINNDGINEIIIGYETSRCLMCTKPFVNSKIYAYGPDNLISGYPIEVPLKDIDVAIGNLNNDEFKEIVVIGEDFYDFIDDFIYIYDYNGNLVNTINLTEITNSVGIVTYSPSFDFDVLLADVNNDNKEEILLTIYSWEGRKDGECTAYVNSTIFMIDSNGQLLNAITLRGIVSKLAAADIDNDNKSEIIFSTSSDCWLNLLSFEYKEMKLHIMDDDGSVIDEWVVTENDYFSNYLKPVLADINYDDKLEIILSSFKFPPLTSRIDVFDLQGNAISGWPVIMQDESAYANPSVSDLNQDDNLEIIVSAYSTTDNNNIYIFDKNGIKLNSISTNSPTYTSVIGGTRPVLINMYNNKDLKINDFWTKEISAWYMENNEVYVIQGFPRQMHNVQTIFFSPDRLSKSEFAIHDLENDGILDLIVTSRYDSREPDLPYTSSVFVWELPEEFSSQKLDWPMYYHDTQHTGCYEGGLGITPPSLGRPQSKIVNNANEDVSGILLIYLEKYENGKWRRYPTLANIVREPITIPANGLIKLDELFNNQDVSINEEGDYRITTKFNYSGKKIEASWEFTVYE